jgi:hypothetical protein
MIVTCWSAKGGSGTTVIAAALGVLLARQSETLLVDLHGDMASVLAATEVPVLHNLRLLRVADVDPVIFDAGEGRSIVIDASGARPGSEPELIARCDSSLLVIRNCYLAIRRSSAASVRPSGIVLVREAWRSFDRHDVERAIGVPVVAEVDVGPAIARTTDAGLLASRLPAQLDRALHSLVESLIISDRAASVVPTDVRDQIGARPWAQFGSAQSAARSENCGHDTTRSPCSGPHTTRC